MVGHHTEMKQAGRMVHRRGPQFHSCGKRGSTVAQLPKDKAEQQPVCRSAESILTSWYVNCTEADQKSLKRLIHASQKIRGLSLVPLNIFRTYYLCRNMNILTDENHPITTSSLCYRAVKARTSRLKNSFVPESITRLNSLKL